MNTLELKSVADLQKLAFYIPDYQRGYRWTQRQVEDLLNDIFEFSQKNNAGIYCLQPLVVKSLNGPWEVVDGQQRLTTICLILEVLGLSRIDITYQTRRDSAEFLNKITTEEVAGEKAEKKAEEKAEEKAKNNIDFYHIYLAVTVIRRWLDEKKIDKEKFQDILLNRVKFIWYETEEDPKEVFARLNIGKISLTNAELIKALLLNKSNFDSSDDDKIRLWQQEIAVEWDVIEYALQSNEFWLFLNAPGDERPTRIDYVFDMICRCDLLGCKDEKEIDATDDFRTFRYVYHYLAVQKQNKISLAQAVRTIWENVREIFHTLQEWFDDMELYHYIGYLIYMGRKVDEIYKQWNVSDGKFEFIEKYLKEEIKRTIPYKDIENTVYEVESAPNKGGSKTNCRPILLLHNLQTVINQNRILGANAKYKNGVFYKFPFHLYKLEGWDVEHIDSNTENGLNDIQSQREWLLNAYFGLQDKAYQTLRDQIQEFFKTRKGDEQNADSDKQTVRNEQFVALKKQIEDIGGSNRLDQNEKNKIWNFTLLDSSTNRSYGNAIFPAKRRVIIGKDQGKRFSLPTIDENGEIVLGSAENGSSSFIPPCTRYVFLKYYNTASFDPNAWTKDDAEAYKNNIKEVLKDFLS
ncbi:MAG TPA: DUF262 domain-containing protein [Candidatus Alistipes faecigallinarum]|nr:DUF262 domain-containing protein [Candidatus Alistipes faecigallinarum]